MAIIYELNPPRLEAGPDAARLADVMIRRASRVAPLADGIHVTDAVLGTRRLGALDSCATLRSAFPDVQMTVSLRTRDRTFESLAADVARAAGIGAAGVLLVRGDPPQDPEAQDSDLYPGAALARLRDQNLTHGVRMLLSLAPSQGQAAVEKKIASRPDGFVTQVISSAEQVRGIVSAMSPHRIGVTPCVMLPSPKNAPSARSLGLDWSGYEDDAVGFVREVEGIAGSVLVSSPRDLAAAESVIGEASRMRPDGAR